MLAVFFLIRVFILFFKFLLFVNEVVLFKIFLIAYRLVTFCKPGSLNLHDLILPLKDLFLPLVKVFFPNFNFPLFLI